MSNFFEENYPTAPMAPLISEKHKPYGKYKTIPWTNDMNLSIVPLPITPDNEANLDIRVASLLFGFERVGNCPKCGQEICRCGYL